MIANTYQAALVTGAGTVEYVDTTTTAPTPGTVTVQVRLCGICGTEVSSYRHGNVHSPGVCGHEWVGHIVEVGAGVSPDRVGERVVAAAPPPCGRCAPCVAGLADHCTTALAVVRGRDPLAPPHGGFARYLTVAEGRVLPALPQLTDEQAAFCEPAAVAFHGIRKAGIRPGDTVAVQGAGPIGLIAAQLARIAGAGRVVVVEPNAGRRMLAESLGLDEAVAPAEADDALASASGGLGADVVVEAAGVAPLLQRAIDLARPGGTVVLVSYLAAPAEVSGARLMANEIHLVGSVAFSHDDLRRVMGLIADGRLQVGPLHSRTVGLTELGTTLAGLADGTDDAVKVLVDPGR